MSAILPGDNDQQKLEALATRTYKDQAIWFLNAFWDTLEDQGERIWDYKHKCDEYDLQKHEEGNALDELNAHRLLEAFQETMTVREMRDSLRETGAIKKDGRLKVVPLVHWLVFKYKVDFHSLVNASQGDNRKEIEEAQRLLDEVTEAFKESEAAATAAASAAREAASAASAAKQSEEQAQKNEVEAKASEKEAVAREADAVAAQAELEAALAEVKAQEDAYNAKTESLKKKSEEGGVVSRNRAKNELAQHLGEDPLPLRRAKITQEAAVKKAEKATNAAKAARTKAEADAVEAEKSARQAEQDRVAAEAAAEAAEARKQEAEAALAEAQAKVAEAEAFLEDVKSRPGCAHGAIWWMERELHEQKKYLPVSKGGVR